MHVGTAEVQEFTRQGKNMCTLINITAHDESVEKRVLPVRRVLSRLFFDTLNFESYSCHQMRFALEGNLTKIRNVSGFQLTRCITSPKSISIWQIADKFHTIM